MLLILTNSRDVTADYLASFLTGQKVDFIRLDTDTILDRMLFSYRVGYPEIKVDGRKLSAMEISNIWYRRPKKLASNRFSEQPEDKYLLREWTEFLEGFLEHVPKEKWMNHPTANAAAENKLEQLSRAHRIGFLVPDTLATQDPNEFLSFYEKHTSNVILKPIGGGYVEREGDDPDSIIYTNRVLPGHLRFSEEISICPVFFQKEIDKATDVRITVVDSEIHAVSMQAIDDSGRQRCDIRRNNMADVDYQKIDLPIEIVSKIDTLMRHYQLRFAAIDMAVDRAGEWTFFEINPNGQWAWLDIAGGQRIGDLFLKSFK